MDTKWGKIEYFINGSAPYALVIHGEMGGWDTVLAPVTVQHWYGAGYGVISPSRPCYLRTPCTTFPYTTEAQADIMVALLDELEVGKVVVVAFSGAGPLGIQIAARHPNRTAGLVMGIAIAGSKPEPPESPFYGLDASGHIPAKGQLFTAIMSNAMINRLAYWATQDPSGSLDSAMLQLSNYTADEKAREKARLLGNKTLLDTVVQITSAGAFPMGSRMVGQANDCANYQNLTLPYSKVKCPVFGVYAKHDSPASACPIEMAYILKEKVPQTDLHILERAWHIIWVAPEWGWAAQKQVEFANKLEW